MTKVSQKRGKQANTPLRAEESKQTICVFDIQRLLLGTRLPAVRPQSHAKDVD
jgi:hypothetical protein